MTATPTPTAASTKNVLISLAVMFGVVVALTETAGTSPAASKVALLLLGSMILLNAITHSAKFSGFASKYPTSTP